MGGAGGFEAVTVGGQPWTDRGKSHAGTATRRIRCSHRKTSTLPRSVLLLLI